MSRQKAPVTPAVMEWAVGESGYKLAVLAQKLRYSQERLESWIKGSDQPTPAQLRAFAKEVRRPSALFYLPAPPQDMSIPTSLRNAPGLRDRELSPSEIRVIRWLKRVQAVLSWLSRERHGNKRGIDLPIAEARTGPGEAASVFREWIDIPVAEQLSWPNARVALEEWRSVLHTRGVAVFQFQINKDAIRGFSVWDDQLPVAALNTGYTPQARVYTLFHEVGHLLRRSEGACSTFADRKSAQLERWCEQFAAAFLLPGDEVRRVAEEIYVDRGSDDQRYDLVRRVATRFNTSVRATAIRLMGLGLADDDLDILVSSRAVSRFEDYPGPSNGGGGRTAAQIRLQHFGGPAIATLLDSVASGHLTPRDVGDYLHLPPRAVAELDSLVSDSLLPR